MQGAIPGNAGIVHKYVDWPQLTLRLRDCGLLSGKIGNVPFLNHHAGLDAEGSSPRVITVIIGDDAMVGIPKQLARGGTDPGITSGDQYGASQCLTPPAFWSICWRKDPTVAIRNCASNH